MKTISNKKSLIFHGKSIGYLVAVTLSMFVFLFWGQMLFGDQVIHLRSPNHIIASDSEGHHLIRVEGFFSYGVPGYPDLPCKIYRIAVPPNVDLGSVMIEINTAGAVSLGKFNIRELPPMATWTDGQQVTADYADIYSNNAFYPQETVELLGTSRMRKWKLMDLKFTPFQYNPVTKDLRMISDVTFTIKYAAHAEKVVPDVSLSDSVMDERAQRVIWNYLESKQWYTPSTLSPRPQVTYDYVIITTNSIVSSSAQLSNFVTYLTNKGYSPLVITETDYGALTGQSPDGTAEKIRQWLINNYVAYSVKYVLLIGNPDPSGDVPMKMCWPRRTESSYQESPTDYFYADLTGNWDLDSDGYFGEYPDDDGTGGVDFTNEVYVGRIPVYSGVANLDSVLVKVMNYGNASGISWRQSALLPMSYSDGVTDGAYLGEAIKTDYLTPASYSSWTMYMQGNLCQDADSSFTSDEELLNGATLSRWSANPYGLVWWWGHGSTTSASLGYSGCGWGTIMNTSGSSSLNDSYPAFVYQCSCTNGYPESSSNLGTALLYNGAIVTVSASRVSWYAVTSWSTGLKYYCDNASIGYYYGKELVSNSKTAAEALYDVKSDMGANHYTGWGGSHWMNLFDFNVYGNPVTALDDQAPIHAVTVPSTPSGPSSGITGISYSFSTGNSVCSHGHAVEYQFDWGNGTYSTWGSPTSISNTWTSMGVYDVRAQARCSVSTGILSGWSGAHSITISPSTPQPEMNIKQGSTSIPDASLYDFDAQQIESDTDVTFTIENFGTTNLNLSGSSIITITGTDADQFSVQLQPSTPVAPGGGTTTFIIRFSPTSAGSKAASISIANDDYDENPYDITLNGTGRIGFYVLDGYGGIHAGGGAPDITPKTPYFGWDIARNLEMISGGSGFYVLDGYGGIHAGGTASDITPKTPYFGWDIARDQELISNGTGFYVLDGYGGIHAGGTASDITPKTPYFGWDIARDMEMVSSGSGFYVLDGYGGIHAGGTASDITPKAPYFGWDIARDLEFIQ